MNDEADNKTLRCLNDFCAAVVILWERLLDKLAIVSWPKMLLFSLLGLMFAGVLGLPSIFYGVILAALAIKLLAGKNRKTLATHAAADKGLNDEKIL